MNGILNREFTGPASNLSCRSSDCQVRRDEAYLKDRELRLELNVSQKGFLDLSYPTLFPSPPDRLKTKDEATWYFYLAEIALRRLKNRILDSLYRHDTASPEFAIEHAIFDFEEQTDAW